ncbi:hypothetical protein C922_05293 [Plasmodium inui San Antonio 1]|uniref:Uncharacterized protein n=1 Tax=Plasmodium inui San Antonio 1 TaxID=1237626 RepID=W7A5G3_9APIC|nr:hypothetical protein C922_05293 [Plasmodium inui San Antonio 1]EUD64319.1 hypothetical protein C922_05293 [Plasmodium inui San Antonio 1]
MGQFHRIMLHWEQTARRERTKTGDVYAANKIEDLKSYNYEEEDESISRWQKMGKKGGSIHLWTTQAAKIICRNLEVWYQNLTLSEEAESEWEETKCRGDNLGVEGSRGTTVACPIDPRHNYWTTLRLGKSLNGAKEEHRSMMICMDLIAILLTVYNNLSRCKGEELCYNETEVCRALYQWYEEWGGQQVAKEVMQFLFQNEQNKMKLGNRNITTNGTVSQFWAKVTGFRGLGLAALQCQDRTWPGTNWRSACYHKNKNSACEIVEDQQWTNDQVRPETERTEMKSSPWQKEIGKEVLEPPRRSSPTGGCRQPDPARPGVKIDKPGRRMKLMRNSIFYRKNLEG